MNYLPSKNIIVTIIVLTAVLVFVLWTANIGNEREKGRGVITVSTQKTGIDKEDTDNDGLKNWEEVLWGTNPNNPDTDGDNTVDGEEISAGRNPLVAGPDDILPKDISELIRKNNGAVSGTSKTDILAKEWFTALVSMQQSGSVDQKALLNISDSFVKEVSREISTPAYTLSDITIKKNPDAESLKKYGNALGSMVKKYSYYSKENELVIMNKAIQLESESELEKLTPIIKAYEEAEQDFIAMTVPEGVSIDHLFIVNSVSGIAQSLKIIKNIFKDPVSAVAAVNNYAKDLEKLNKSIVRIKKYFSAEGIVFNENDSGYILFYAKQK